jgi:hypothetical protein
MEREPYLSGAYRYSSSANTIRCVAKGVGEGCVAGLEAAAYAKKNDKLDADIGRIKT